MAKLAVLLVVSVWFVVLQACAADPPPPVVQKVKVDQAAADAHLARLYVKLALTREHSDDALANFLRGDEQIRREVLQPRFPGPGPQRRSPDRGFQDRIMRRIRGNALAVAPLLEAWRRTGRRTEYENEKALGLLAAVGPEAQAALPELIGILRRLRTDLDPSEADFAFVDKIRNPQGGGGVLFATPDDRHSNERITEGATAAAVLGAIGLGAKSAVPELMALVVLDNVGGGRNTVGGEPRSPLSYHEAQGLVETALAALVRIAPDSPQVFEKGFALLVIHQAQFGKTAEADRLRLLRMKLPADDMLARLQKHADQDRELARVVVVDLLGDWPTSSPAADTALEGLANGSDGDLRERAQELLRNRQRRAEKNSAPAAKAELKSLLASLASDDYGTRQEAALQMRELLAQDEAAAIDLLRQVSVGRNSDGTEIREWFSAARFTRNSVPELLKILAECSKHEKLPAQPQEKRSTIEEPERPGENAFERNVRAMLQNESQVRSAWLRADLVFQVLERLGPEAEGAIPVLIDYLQGENGYRSALTLVGIGPRAVPELVKLLEDPSGEMVPQVCLILSAMGPAAEGATAALIQIVKQRSPAQATVAAGALGCIGPAAAGPLAELAKSGGLSRRQLAASALANTGPIAVEALIQLVADEQQDDEVRMAALEGLKTLGESAAPAVEELIRQVGGADVARREAAIDALVAIGPGAAPATDVLIQAIKEGDSEMAVQALTVIGPPAKAALPMLLERLRTAHFDKEAKAIRAIGPDGPTAIQLLKLLEKQEVPRWAELALAGAGPDVRSAAPQIIQLLGSDNPSVAAHAAILVARIGPPAKAAVPALRKALASEDKLLVASATCALGKIGGAAAPAKKDLQKMLARGQSAVVAAELRKAIERIQATSQGKP